MTTSFREKLREAPHHSPAFKIIRSWTADSEVVSVIISATVGGLGQ
jgi:hypothetical protein